MKKLLVMAIFCIMLAYTAAADLEITDIDVWVDGSKEGGISSSGGTVDNVDIESTVKVKVTVENTFSDQDLEEITVEGILEGIDPDGDDIDEESSDFDLDDGKDKTVTLEFDIPLQVEEGTYTLELTAKGENSSGADFTDTATLDIEVEKDKHKLLLDALTLDKTEMTCDRDTQLHVVLYNVGTEDEDVVLTITNDALGINILQTFELVYDIDDNDNKYNRYFTIEAPDTGAAGTFPIQFKATYDDGDEDVTESINLVISDCETATTSSSTSSSTTDSTTTTTDDVVVTSTPTTTTTSSQAVTARPVTSTKPGVKGNSGITIALIVLAYIIVIAVAIMLILKFVRKD